MECYRENVPHELAAQTRVPASVSSRSGVALLSLQGAGAAQSLDWRAWG